MKEDAFPSSCRVLATSLALWLSGGMMRGCSDPLIRAQGDVTVKSAVPIDGNIRIPTTVPIDGGVRIVQTVPVALQGPLEITIQPPSVAYQGTFVSEEIMKLIKEGETTAEYVRAILGEPDFKSDLSDGTEVWRWTYAPVRDQTSFFSLLGKGDKEPRPEHVTVVIRFRGGVCIEKWRG